MYIRRFVDTRFRVVIEPCESKMNSSTVELAVEMIDTWAMYWKDEPDFVYNSFTGTRALLMTGSTYDLLSVSDMSVMT